MSRKFMMVGALAGAIAVAMGALGAHTLESLLGPDRLDIYQTGVRYLMVHSIILFITGRMSKGRNDRVLFYAGMSFISGMILFSGSLLVLALANIRMMGAVAPIGGLAYIVGWLLLAWAAHNSDA